MSTFFGGKQVSQRLIFRDSLTSVVGTFFTYTCPAGKYAKIYIRRLDGFDFGSEANLTVQVDGVVQVGGNFNGVTIRNNIIMDDSNIDSLNKSSNQIEVDAGQALTLFSSGSTDNVDYDIVVTEYNLP